MTEEKAKKVLQEQIDKYGQEYDAEGIEALEMAIKALEQPEWIPVSERLPEKEEIVLITIDSSYYPRPDVDMGFYKVETKKWYWFNKEDINPSIKVIGWMPLPQPYKIESEE